MIKISGVRFIREEQLLDREPYRPRSYTNRDLPKWQIERKSHRALVLVLALALVLVMKRVLGKKKEDLKGKNKEDLKEKKGCWG